MLLFSKHFEWGLHCISNRLSDQLITQYSSEIHTIPWQISTHHHALENTDKTIIL